MKEELFVSRRSKKGSKTKVILITILIILIIAAGVLLALKFFGKSSIDTDNGVVSLGTDTARKEESKINIFQGNDRPIAVMIDNHSGAWPQAGLNKAYMVYEIIVEGGETRLMALFKGQDLDKIGPVRSSRHYFLDYAMENDAIYVHYGWSPEAQSDISKYKVNNINGLTESESTFWRVKDKAAPHNAVTSTKKILASANNHKYNTKSNKESVLSYTPDAVTLEDGINATDITIPYSTLQTVEYKYNAETMRYERYARGKKQTDWETKEMITTKNIIITFAENYELSDGENKDRQGLKNIGTRDGYYITNGKAIKITCEKKDRTEQTVYKDLNGNEIKVNDGNTFVQICPIDSKVTFE